MPGTGLTIRDHLDWAEFVAEFWDRRPVLYRKVPTAPFTAGEAFTAATRACRPGTGGALPSGVQLTIGSRQPSFAEGREPQASDDDLAGYGNRMTRSLGSTGYALVVNAVHAYDFALWRRERAFFAPLWQRVGVPSTGAITTLFHGNYDHSPVGVHKDRFATFMYVVSGAKRMRLWPHRPWDHDATTLTDYDQYRPQSVAADVSAGQLLYWPSSYFHVGEHLDAGTATSLNVGVPRELHNAQFDLQELVLDLTPDALVDSRPHLLQKLPSVKAALHAEGAGVDGHLRHLVPPAVTEADQLAESHLTALWNSDRRSHLMLARHSAGGFFPVPPEDATPTVDDTELHPLDPHSPPVWCRHDETTSVAIHGHVTETQLPPAALAKLVDWWRSDQPATLPELTNHLALSSTDQLTPLVHRLAAFRAFRRPSDEQ